MAFAPRPPSPPLPLEPPPRPPPRPAPAPALSCTRHGCTASSAPEDAQTCTAGCANLHFTVLHAAPNLQGLMLALPPPPPSPPCSAGVVSTGWSGAGCAKRQDTARHFAPNLHALTVDTVSPVTTATVGWAACTVGAGAATGPGLPAVTAQWSHSLPVPEAHQVNVAASIEACNAPHSACTKRAFFICVFRWDADFPMLF